LASLVSQTHIVLLSVGFVFCLFASAFTAINKPK